MFESFNVKEKKRFLIFSSLKKVFLNVRTWLSYVDWTTRCAAIIILKIDCAIVCRAIAATADG